jgi:hypothetical protein
MFGQEFKITLDYFWTPKQIVKVEKEENETVPKLGEMTSDTISNRLKQLLLVAEMKNGRKKVACGCGHICDKKSKKDEALQSSVHSTSIGDNLIFKHPQVPAKTPLSNIGQINTQKYKQSRWWRMRGNRPIEPQTTKNQRFGFLPGPNRPQQINQMSNQNLSMPLLSPNDSSTVQIISSSVVENQSDSVVNSTNEEEGVTTTLHEENLTQLLEDKIQSSTFSSDSNLSLSLFDISLPSASTSTTFIGEFVSDLDRADSNLSSISALKILRESPEDDGRLLDENISDLSLSSFLGHLDAVYERKLETPNGRCSKNEVGT